MANEFALMSLADSLARRLAQAYPAALRAAHACAFKAIGSGGLLSDPPLEGAGAVVTVWPYRVTVNPHWRALPPEQIARQGRREPPMTLDVHLLLTVWSDSTATELVVFAWMMRELHRAPLLDASTLTGDAGWSQGDVIEVLPTEMGVEDMMRLWAAITPSYRLSAPYSARVVSIDVADDDAQ